MRAAELDLGPMLFFAARRRERRVADRDGQSHGGRLGEEHGDEKDGEIGLRPSGGERSK